MHPWPSHPSFVCGGLQSLPSTGEPPTSLQLVHSVNSGPVNLKAHFCRSRESPDLLFFEFGSPQIWRWTKKKMILRWLGHGPWLLIWRRTGMAASNDEGVARLMDLRTNEPDCNHRRWRRKKREKGRPTSWTCVDARLDFSTHCLAPHQPMTP